MLSIWLYIYNLFLLLFHLFAHAHQLRSHAYPSTCLHINIDYTFCPEGESKVRESLCKCENKQSSFLAAGKCNVGRRPMGRMFKIVKTNEYVLDNQ